MRRGGDKFTRGVCVSGGGGSRKGGLELLLAMPLHRAGCYNWFVILIKSDTLTHPNMNMSIFFL